ncbi:autoinducer(acylhomoserine lactone) synthesis protein, partial [Glycocaulis profundi]
MRVHIVTPANRGLYGVQLEQMHRQRREVFIDRLGWSEIDTGEELERD